MSIKKTSILALSVLLSYESFAAPTVLATTPRLGASSSVASTGRGKATTSVSIGGGLNKLTSNRGQGSFTPNSAPTDKQNELIENFQKEIQNVRDAVAEELQDQNDTIKELKEKIKEKDEEIAELKESIEESIDEKIESKGFITAESVEAEISTAKQEAVRQAKIAVVNEVESMGFAKTATVRSDILSAKNAAIEQAKTEAVAAVNGMGFAKSETVQSEILNAKDAAIELAKTAALAEVESKGFATTTSVQNLRTEIANERAATTAQIDAVKSEIQEDVDQLNNNINNINIDGAIENKLASKGYATTTQLTENINAVKNEIQADVEELNNNINNINIDGAIENKLASKGYATTTQLAEDINAAKEAAIAAANTAITEELGKLELGVDETTLADIINAKLQAGDFATVTDLNELSEKVTQNTQNITEESGKIANLDARLAPGFVTPAELTTYQGEVAGTIATLEKDLDDVNGTLADFGNNIASELVNNKDFTDSVLSGLGDTVDGLARRVTAAEGTINSLGTTYATKGEIAPDVLTGKLSGKFVAKEGLSSTIAGLKDEEGNDIFVKPSKFNEELTNSTTFKELDTRFVPSKDVKDEKGNYTFVTQTDVKKIPSAVITEMQNSKSEYYIGNWTDSTGKKKLLVTQNDIEDETSSLGSALKNVNSAVTKAQSTADTASTTASNAESAANAAQSTADDAKNTADAASTDIESLDTRVTSAETSLANDVVTKTSLSADLLAELTANTSSDQCSEPTGTTGDLINLLNSGTIGECGRNYTPAK